MSRVNRTAFAVVGADVEVVTAIRVDGQLVEVQVPYASYDRISELVPLAFISLLTMQVPRCIDIGASADYMPVCYDEV